MSVSNILVRLLRECTGLLLRSIGEVWAYWACPQRHRGLWAVSQNGVSICQHCNWVRIEERGVGYLHWYKG